MSSVHKNAAGEDVIDIPNVPILIPGPFSKLKFEPEYVLPLFVYVWRHAIKDPADPVRIDRRDNGDLKWPQNFVSKVNGVHVVDRTVAVREVPAAEAVQLEEARLRRDFGDEVFEAVYGKTGHEFHVVCQALIDESEAGIPTKMPAASAVV